MSFLYPQFLFALAALLIPVIVHLFNFRRYKKILFTNVSILKDIETSSKSVKQLKNLLILLSRLLGLAFLVFAFAQPIIPISEYNQGRSTDRLVIFIDNSHSMEMFYSGKSQLDWAKTAASEVLKKRSHETTVHIMSNDFMQSEMNELNTEDALSDINKISFSPHRRSFAEIVNRIHALSENYTGDEIQCYIISDFQRNQFDLSLSKPDSTLFFHFVKTTNKETANLSLDSCWLLNLTATLEGKDSIGVRIRNFSSEDIKKQMLRLYVNDNQVWMGSFEISGGGKKDLTIPLNHYEFGKYNCRIEFSDNALNFDNQLYFSYQIDSAPSVYYLGSEKYARPFKALFQQPFKFNQDIETSVDISVLNSSNCIIHAGSGNLSSGLVEVINNRVKEGASLVLIPSDSALSGDFNKMLSHLSAGQIQHFDTSKASISSINLSSDLLSSVVRKFPDNPNLPSASGHFKLKADPGSVVEDILMFRDGPALRRIPIENGNIYLFSFDLDEKKSNMVRHSLFVPIMINAAFSGNRKYPLYYTLDKNELIEVHYSSGSDEVYHLTGNNIDIIPEIKRLSIGNRLQFDDQLRLPGNYQISLSDQFIRSVSFNYSRDESDLETFTDDEIQEMIDSELEFNGMLHTGQFDDVITSLRQSISHTSLWKYCIILALMFFISEVLIIKFVKT